MNANDPAAWLSWAPDACTLPRIDRPLREAEFDSFFPSAVKEVRRTPASTAVFTLNPEPAVAAQVAELAARETSCCSFFTFTLTVTAGGLSLEVAVPAAHQPVLDAMVERATTHLHWPGR
jgi:hypothetical protein